MKTHTLIKHTTQPINSTYINKLTRNHGAGGPPWLSVRQNNKITNTLNWETKKHKLSISIQQITHAEISNNKEPTQKKHLSRLGPARSARARRLELYPAFQNLSRKPLNT